MEYILRKQDETKSALVQVLINRGIKESDIWHYLLTTIVYFGLYLVKVNSQCHPEALARRIFSLLFTPPSPCIHRTSPQNLWPFPAHRE